MNFSSKKANAWITGHNGFIGKELIKNLDQEFEIFKISRNDIIESNKFFQKKFSINSINISNIQGFKNNFLFHLATSYNLNPTSAEEITDMIESNLLFGLRLLHNLGYDFFSKIVLTQSYLEFQKSLSMNIYTQTKSIFANEVEKNISGKIIKIYIYDTFGLSDKRKKLINLWLQQLVLNQPVTIFSERTKINLSSKKFISKIISKINFINPGQYEIRSEVEMSLIELFYCLKDITNSKSEIIIKNNNPIEIPKKFNNLSEILKIKYTIEDFKKDVMELLNKEIYI